MRNEEAVESFRQAYEGDMPYASWVSLLSMLKANYLFMTGLPEEVQAGRAQEMAKGIMTMAISCYLVGWKEKNPDATPEESMEAGKKLVMDSNALYEMGIAVVEGPDGHMFKGGVE